MQRLPPAPSGIGEAADATPAETGNRLADLNLDDLLGLKDDTPTTSAAESAAGEKAAPASSSDPFAPPQVQHMPELDVDVVLATCARLLPRRWHTMLMAFYCLWRQLSSCIRHMQCSKH